MSTKSKLLTDQATQQLICQLKEKIGAGIYRPGEWLKQIDIERSFNVNRFTVRSAFTELSNSGFLQHVPYKGYRVIEHSIQERIAITEARELLESAVALKVMANVDSEGLEELQTLAEGFREAFENSDQKHMMERNFAFHRTFYRYANNTYLSNMIDEMRERGVGRANQGWAKPSTVAASCQDHFDMVEALRQRNITRLQSLIYQHLNRWREGYEEL
ncbi:GntR family transcriptional regulator [Neptunomonas sp. XY-337]|uniref:GntR family transcriptional regulator n=1 Tax=Neptunomonas sp. XY-337 TaxID=2561897 RepID=UPI0010AB1D16|nr:GntR family transcriptional regulator [Neptunomonas sp. XY-337]